MSDVSKPAWRPPLLVQATMLIHGGAIAWTAFQPLIWPWALGALVLNHLALASAGLWPRSRLLGANLLRMPTGAPEVAITIDDGPDPEVTPKVLEILARHGAKASFFCIGTKVRQHAELAREIVAQGHSIENHSEHHLHRFSVLGPSAMAREVLTAQESIALVTGRAPRYFRAPAGLRNPFLDRILHNNDLQLASWTRRGFDTRESRSDKVLERLTRKLAAGDILLLHDGNAARPAGQQPVILDVLPRLLEQLQQQGLRAVALPRA